jgi:uracil-DNA glycosylase
MTKINEWKELIEVELQKDYMSKLSDFIQMQREKNIVYPQKEDIFKAFEMTPINEIKVVILGQDPYPDGNADGLAFSCRERVSKSLLAIMAQIPGYENKIEISGNKRLYSWARQGVLLTNTCLTVDKGKPKSHQGQGWEIFVKKCLEAVAMYENLVILLWGKEAQKFADVFKHPSHVVLMAEHPAASSYQQRAWNSNDCFNQANVHLKRMNKEPIEWYKI